MTTFDRSASSSSSSPSYHQMDTALAHAGVAAGHNVPMAPPLHVSTTYTRPPDGQYLEDDSIYTRHDNPTRLLLEREIAQLETIGISRPTATPSEEGIQTVTCAFSSGMAAATSIVLAHQLPLHVILPMDLYHGVSTMLLDVFDRFQVKVDRVDMTQLDQIENALTMVPAEAHAIVWMESPSNPLCHVLDVESIVQLVQKIVAHEPKQITTVVDATLSTPRLMQPLSWGADLVMHSATKYLAGHSDALIGVVTASPWTRRGQELGPRLKQVQECTGNVASPWDSWLTLRGLRTLAVRIPRQSQSALKVATFLQEQRRIRAVHYPGLPSHPQHEVAHRQMEDRGYGGVMSFEVVTAAEAMELAARLQIIQRATSLGGTETLIEHRASIEPPGRVTSPEGLLRLSIGLESPDDIIQDLRTALQSLG